MPDETKYGVPEMPPDRSMFGTWAKSAEAEAEAQRQAQIKERRNSIHEVKGTRS